ncbi:adenosyltransferase [Gracilibacillus halophilus YIM-C55.5]|uniref:Adenosyltransferase n=1 Tax=Gracilibacillus halophilus YIM-C55.5 TaxID=1308866 RepID=N4WL07_9BACI|nr:S-adenosyl-l-methionine hydroxide adenosyltransferase family protein [Gracilibacillus halophilus]ENH96857.1 adenosyltransferase [Gracilibacillus halophilus YIM-C55.5]
MMNALVLQSDFGLEDGAVSAMKGVAYSVSKIIPIYDNTHGIPPFHIWEASYRLWQTISYWPEETVFVSVVDPGVGSNRKSVVARTHHNRYIVTPDNGTLTLIHEKVGISEVREIDENHNRLPQSHASDTFHGRDVYAYTGAKLASGVISFHEVGERQNLDEIVTIPFQKPVIESDKITGMIDIHDVRFGNVWTNISRELFSALYVECGDQVQVTIQHGDRNIYRQSITFARSFAAIPVGEPVVYINSLGYLAIAMNQGSFAKTYQIGSGENWRIDISVS